MSLTDVRPTYSDDVVLWEADNARDEVTFKNNTGGTDSFPVGRTLVVSGAYLVPAPANDADAVLLTAITDIANNGTQNVAVIGSRGNCTLNIDRMTYGDGGTAFDAAAQLQVDALAAAGCKMVQEPDVSSNG